MHEQELQDLIGAVRSGRVSRRAFVGRMVGVGLTAPFATQLLAHAGMAQAPTNAEYKPTKAGGGGSLKMLYWQAATLLNPHFAVGTKDQEGSRIFYEPLAAWDPDGNLVPMLAAEIPDLENGGVAPDGMSVIWKLKKDVTWHDGRPGFAARQNRCSRVEAQASLVLLGSVTGKALLRQDWLYLAQVVHAINCRGFSGKH